MFFGIGDTVLTSECMRKSDDDYRGLRWSRWWYE